MKPHDPEWINYTKYFIYIANTVHIVHITYALLATGNQEQILIDYLQLRNIIYMMYVVTFMILGLLALLKGKAFDERQKYIYGRLTAIGVIGIILTTFSYAIANVLYTVIKMIQ